MIQMTSTIEFNLLLQINQRIEIVALLCCISFLECNIQIVNIGLVVFLMVKLHDLGRNDRFKSIVIVRQVRKRVFSPLRDKSAEAALRYH